jgi:hypothetical protein
MAIAATAVTGASHVAGNKRRRFYDLVFSGNYATGGEAFTAATFGLRKVHFINVPGAAVTTDRATSVVVGVDYTNSKFLFYEGSAAGTALTEKTNAEVYPTGCTMRVEVVGH